MRPRPLASSLALVLAPALLAAQSPAPVEGPARPDAPVDSVAPRPRTALRVGALAMAAVGAASGAQLSRSPDAWPRTFGGFGRRVADQAGFIVVEESLRDGLVALTGWRPDARPCRRDAVTLLPCATARAFSARTVDGRTRPNLPLMTGIVGATAVSLAWRPEGRAGGGDAARLVATRLAIGFGATVLVRAAREWSRPAAR